MGGRQGLHQFTAAERFSMAAWTRYRETGYVLFAIWVAGLVDIICACVIPAQPQMLLFESRLEIIPVPAGLLAVFSFVLWLRLKLA
jgi:hypothetical protein